MRITERSPQRLVLKDSSVWVSALCFAAAAFVVAFSLLSESQPRNTWIVGLLFAVFGLLALGSSTVVFDKATALCSVNRLNLFKRVRLSIPFADILDVRIDVEPLNAASEREHYRLSLLTSSRSIALSASYERDIQRFNDMRAAILDILSRPDTAPSDPVQLLVAQGRIVDAVALLRQRDHLDLETARQRVAEMEKQAKRDQ